MLDCDIFVPCKALGLGKSRLATLLSRRERHELCVALLSRTLAVTKCLARPDRIWLVTGDAEAAAHAEEAGVSVIMENVHDLNGALAYGRRQVMRRRRMAELLVLPIDLPFADPTAIARARVASDIAIAGDHDGRGTNLLMLRGEAAERFEFRFGAESFARHCEGARNAGYSLAVLDDPALAFDIDEPAHYLGAGVAASPPMARPS
jgi:2-phospho-L-lactate guanylyltransferase